MISKGNHVKFARFVLLAVSEEAKTWLPGLLRWPSKTSKTRTQKHKKVDESAKGAVCWSHEREKTERTWGKERVGTNFENILCRSEKCIIKQLLDSVFVIFRIIKVSVRVISLSRRLRLTTPTSTLIILDITKTSSNNCLLFRLVPAVVLTLELLKRKCPPFLFSQLKQLNLAPRSSR